MALPPEKISELKQIIHTHLSQMDVQNRIKSVLTDPEDIARLQRGDIQEEELLSLLREKGIIEDVMRQLQFDTSGNIPGAPQPQKKPSTHFYSKEDHLSAHKQMKHIPIDPTRRSLYIQILRGKAFLEHIGDQDPLPGQSSAFFTIHINFRGQRFKSRPTPCACEPDFQEGFLLELHKASAGEAARMADSPSLLSLADPIHIVLIKTDPSGETSLISSNYMEWRPVLAAPNCRCTMTVELNGVGSENRVPVGILEVLAEVIPKMKEPLREDIITAQRGLEKNKQAERERLFLVYAKQWWKEYLQIRIEHKDRLVKIFAQDENGSNRPVCSYLRPMRAGRLLDTPRQAARFVSLIGYEKALLIGGGGRAEQWSSMHAFLCRNKGDCEDHAVLLCSLLLGFGLDAFVCIGTKSKGVAHTWVLVIGTDGTTTFWESLTGHRYIHTPIDPDAPPAIAQPKPAYPYRTIGCVFNEKSFYANCQGSDLVELCQFDLVDESLWKCMSPDAVQAVTAAGTLAGYLPPLCPNPVDGPLASNTLELELRTLVSEHRSDQGLTTQWDDHLSYVLTPALAAYETERVTGITAGNEEFQQAVRRAVPDGHTFKGYPIQFVHRNARRAFTACLKSNVCDEIVNCRGDHVRLALRVKVFTYPENATATWIMFACKYKSVV